MDAEDAGFDLAAGGGGDGAQSVALKRSREAPKTSVLNDEGEVAHLVLADGTRVAGMSFGARRSVSGEAVFNTGMVGYPEALTDPSYRGQILILTYPMVGNYGVPDMAVLDEFGLNKYFESDAIHITGLVVANYNEDHSHWNSTGSLGAWLKAHNVPAITGVDTRMLTKLLRERGSCLAKIEFPGEPVALADPNLRNLVAEVSTKTVRVLNKGGSPRICAVDCGMKFNIMRYLARTGMELVVVPYDHDFTAHPIACDGLFISNGPGDPSMCASTIAQLRNFIASAEQPTPVAASATAAASPSAAAAAPAAAATSSWAGRDYGKGQRIVPVMGICLGNQLLALAAGAKTYKMKYGNRGQNQPAIDLRTMRCYITPQNHGYAVDAATLPRNWKPFFVNANDSSNEGIIHTHLPFFSVQFHPEANGGPLDTAFLFDMFLEQVQGAPPSITTIDASVLLARGRRAKKVLLLGSGGLSIGQAGEFDYSGSQAIKALKEEGVEVVLINPNIATVQTSKGMADKVYFLPVTHQFVEEVIRKERPDGILISMGGQTALNVGLSLERAGVLAKYAVAVLGTPTKAVVATEDREIFSSILASIGETCAKSYAATNVEDAVAAAQKIGFPVLVRAAYALGGLGSGFAANEGELRELLDKSFACSDQVLVDQDLRGWKEIEYEVVRDANDNCITVCNMENFDPLGVHTGDSIVVAPSQTLSNSEYYMLRATALKVVRHLGIVGECNIQYALNPESEKYCIIEVNARLSRSSALASKATGYPLAYVAAKLALGHDLVSLRNSVTKTTTACFEPALDYCVVKVPRWDLKKFGSRVDTRIGSAMKSVGEVMSIGRTFEEAIQKAVRMVNPNLSGFGPPASYSPQEPYFGILSPSASGGGQSGAAAAASAATARGTATVAAAAAYTAAGGSTAPAAAAAAAAAATPGGGAATTSSSSSSGASSASSSHAKGASPRLRGHHASDPMSPGSVMRHVCSMLDEKLQIPQDTRLMDIAVALEIGYTVDRVAALTKIDRWFLTKLKKITDMAQALEGLEGLGSLTAPMLRKLKRCGFSDKQIGQRVGAGEANVRAHRLAAGIRPYAKQIDTLAAEFPAQTNYLYMTYHGSEDDVAPAAGSVMVLGGGPYCIGSSVEFDWCAVSAIRTLRANGTATIMVNCNPETVSTDYDESDRLYFEELSLERVMDIYEYEQVSGVIVSVGGQIPNNLSIPMARAGARILGTSPENIDCAEDRQKFSKLLDRLGVDQPSWLEVSSVDECKAFAGKVGYPVLVRPSYVLSGAAMKVAQDEEQLKACLAGAAVVSPDHPVVVSKFIVNAKEIEFDGVAKDGKVLNYAISEHVENAGVHSGDATLVLPAQKLYVETIRQVKRIAQGIARALSISGPFNIQFMSRENEVKVIECNLRASRTFPFVSKTFDFNFIALATRVMAGLPAKPGVFHLEELEYVGVKAPQFSFSRLQGADPTLGVEMVSTGEVGCFGVDMYEAFLLAIIAAGFKLPLVTRNILVSIGSTGKTAMLDSIKRLQRCGYNIFATEGTKRFLEGEEGGMSGVVALAKPSAGAASAHPSATDYLKARKLDLVINEPETGDKESSTDGFHIRRTAIDFGVSLITNAKCAVLLSLALEKMAQRHFTIRSIEEFYANIVDHAPTHLGGRGAGVGGGAPAGGAAGGAAGGGGGSGGH